MHATDAITLIDGHDAIPIFLGTALLRRGKSGGLEMGRRRARRFGDVAALAGGRSLVASGICRGSLGREII
jgi:hypothetical protein